jgi:two-component system chemotaxis response regulator CheY
MRVLVCDDSSTLRALLKLHLRRVGGREAFFVENGREAAEWVQNNGRPDLILLDINMPVMNGLEFLERRKTLDVPEDVPVIILSTEGKDADVQRGLAAGAKVYLRKPFTAQELESSIAKALGLAE